MANKDWRIEFGKVLITAAVPTVLKRIFYGKPPKPKPLCAMVDNVDWDAEYEELLSEEDKKRKKRFPKLRKARE